MGQKERSYYIRKPCKNGGKNNANPCDTENMIFVIQPTERLENDKYGYVYYKLIIK